MTEVSYKVARNVALGFPLSSLEIRRFRAFQHLRIDRLGRVNLIVGKNNVGKTCILEALQAYARNGAPDVLWSILSGRDELRPDEVRRERELTRRQPELFPVTDLLDDDLAAIGSLFYGRPYMTAESHSKQFDIGPAMHGNFSKTLSITAEWARVGQNDRGYPQPQLELFTPTDSPQYDVGPFAPRLVVRVGELATYVFPIEEGFPYYRRARIESSGLPCAVIRAGGLTHTQVGSLYDIALKRGQEQEILNALRIISPGVERLNFIGERDRIPIVTMTGFRNPIPLRSLGDGMVRLLGIAASLASINGGLLLVDEIETGIHYSAQQDMWRLIFQMAHRLNVQVFATTHSWDCIEAFQEAAQEDESAGMLIRLQDRDGQITPTLFDERELSIVTRRQLEVR